MIDQPQPSATARTAISRGWARPGTTASASTARPVVRGSRRRTSAEHTRWRTRGGRSRARPEERDDEGRQHDARWRGGACSGRWRSDPARNCSPNIKLPRRRSCPTTSAEWTRRISSTSSGPAAYAILARAPGDPGAPSREDRHEAMGRGGRASGRAPGRQRDVGRSVPSCSCGGLRTLNALDRFEAADAGPRMSRGPNARRLPRALKSARRRRAHRCRRVRSAVRLVRMRLTTVRYHSSSPGEAAAGGRRRQARARWRGSGWRGAAELNREGDSTTGWSHLQRSSPSGFEDQRLPRAARERVP